MIFNSIGFIVFFPALVAAYHICPKRFRHICLLIASYVFYSFCGAVCLLLLLGQTLITYSLALLIKPSEGKKRKTVFAAGVFFSLAFLAVFKYMGFFLSNIYRLLSLVHIQMQPESFSLLLPVGISFYTFKSLGYLTDVYRGKTEAERNILKYALFIAFFPQLVAGPIDRADNLLRQIKKPHGMTDEDFRYGVILMLWGYFEKLAIADRLGVLVDAVYDNHTAYSGSAIMLATVFYGIQIYADFAGYSHIAIGASRILGYRVGDNFLRPYLAADIKDFWSRWHISMSTWFRDYLYIPLGGNRKGKIRKYLNYMITFLLSGLWHGASWNFVAWGGLHGIYNVLSQATRDARQKIAEKTGFDGGRFSGRLIKCLMTFVLVDFAWMFFRAGSLSVALDMTRRMITDFRLWSLSGDWLYELGLSQLLLRSILPCTLILFAVDILRELKVDILAWFDRQGIVFRWLCYTSSVFLVILFAVQNMGEISETFIYFRF